MISKQVVALTGRTVIEPSVRDDRWGVVLRHGQFEVFLPSDRAADLEALGAAANAAAAALQARNMLAAEKRQRRAELSAVMRAEHAKAHATAGALLAVG